MANEHLSNDELFAQFTHPDPMTRLGAGLELTYRDDNTVPHLVALLADPRSSVRATAVYTLGHMASSAAALDADDERLEGDPAFRARIEALPAALPKVRELFTGDLDADVRYHAFGALSFYGAVDIPTAEAALLDGDARIRATAAFALRRLDPTSPAAARGFAGILLAPEEEGSNGWQESAMMLEQMGPAAAPALSALAMRLQSGDIDPDLRQSLLDAVRAIGSPEAMALLEELAA